MGEPTKAELLSAVCALQGVVQEMNAAYGNDVAQGRAEKMEKLAREGNQIGQQIIDRFPYSKVEAAYKARKP